MYVYSMKPSLPWISIRKDLASFEFLGLEGDTIEQKSRIFFLILQEKTAIGPLTAS
jgi:hypothetical protein